MFERPIFIDFDGVIFDTEKRVVQQKEQLPKISWEEFFATLDWFKLLEESKVINNAVDYILEGQEKNKKIAILTKIHTLLEMQAKVNKLRNCNINVPILFVPPHVKKTSIYLPNNGEILIDDSIKNLKDWKEHGGVGIHFDENLNFNSEFQTINVLKKVL